MAGEEAPEERVKAEVYDVEPVGAQQERDQREGGGGNFYTKDYNILSGVGKTTKFSKVKHF